MKRVVLITGSSRGIGKAIAISFAQVGYDVVINYKKNELGAVALKRQLEESYSTQVLLVPTDVSDEEQVKGMVKNIIDTFGRIDVLVNNAGIVMDKEFVDRTAKDFEKTLATNLIGPFLVSKYVGEVMLENRGG